MSARLYLANAGRRSVLDRPTALLSLSFDAALYVVERTESVAVTVTLARENVTDNVTLSVAGLPAGTTGSFSPTVLSGGTLVSTLTILAIGSAALVNLHTVTVSASTALGVATSRSFTLTVEDVVVAPGALFVLSTSASTINLVRDSTATVTLNLVRAGGFTATVTPAMVQALPSGVTVAFVPATFAGATTSVVATFTATDVAALGIAPLTIRGTGAGSEPNDTSFSVQVIAAGAFAHLASPYTLPTQEDDTPMTFNVNTGLYEGTVFDTSWLTRAWLIANADTIVTMKASGGTYTLTQASNVLSDSASRNDVTVVVVDSGAIVNRPSGATTAPKLRNKAATYDQANWTIFVSSDWWDGTWNPTGQRYPDLRPSPLGADERQHMFTWRNGNAATGEWGVIYTEPDCQKYAFIGCYFEPNPDRTLIASSAAVLQLSSGSRPRGIILRWSVVDAGFRLNPTTGVARRGARCVITNGDRLAIENSMLMRNFFNGSENNTFTQISGRRTKIIDTFIEGDSLNVIVGGGQPGEGWHPEDMEFRRIYSVKTQTYNAASTVFGFNLFTAWADGGGTGGFAVNNPNAWGGPKQHIEVKFGRRILIEGNVVDTIFLAASNTGGTGISVQATGQGGAVSGIECRDVTVANNYVVRCQRPFYLNPFYNVRQDFGIVPTNRVAVLNNVLMRNRLTERSADTREDLLGMTSSGMTSGATGNPVTYGPFMIEHNTWVVPTGETAEGGWDDWRQIPFPASNGTPVTYDYRLRKNLLPNRWKADASGIRYTNANTHPASDFTEMSARRAIAGDVLNIEDNGIVLGIPRMTRNATSGAFPDQYEPAELWQSQGDNPWGWVSHVSDPFACDFSLAADSPLKGICADGTDPGVSWAVLQAATAGVRNYNPEDIVFPDSVGIVVDFV